VPEKNPQAQAERVFLCLEMLSMTFLLDRLREPSTWRGLALLAAACGVTITPERMDAIVSAGLAISGLIGVFVPDKKN
jgi:hypothetical protein